MTINIIEYRTLTLNYKKSKSYDIRILLLVHCMFGINQVLDFNDEDS
jgi:hypothetical protein